MKQKPKFELVTLVACRKNILAHIIGFILAFLNKVNMCACIYHNFLKTRLITPCSELEQNETRGILQSLKPQASRINTLIHW